MASLIVRSREGVCTTVELSAQPISLGRAETCDVVLPNDAEVSREHAQVWLDESGRVMVADRGSKNGTRVDSGNPFHGATRPARNLIRIGEYELEVVQQALPTLPETLVRFVGDESPDTDNTHYFPSTRELDLNQQRLTLLMNLTERIGGAFEPTQLLEQALDACCEALGFERGLIALKTHRGDPELPITRNIQRDESGAFKVSRTLINRALVEGHRAVVNNPAVDLVDNLSESLVRFPICSALCVPILHRDSILGVVYGDRVTRAATYTPEDVDFLAAIARQVGVGLENLRLFKAYLDTERMKGELERARTIQRGLLPAEPLRRERLTISGHNQPSEAVGGDYFDYFDLGGGRIGLIIADVTGHGLPAALMMANFQAAARVALTADAGLAEVAARLNRLIGENTDTNVFITAIVGRVDAATAEIEYVNAGHPAPVLLGPGRAEPVDDGHSLPFGIEPDEVYTPLRITHSGNADGVLFYTDGLTEAADPTGKLLTLIPVIETLAAIPKHGTEVVLPALLTLVRQHLDGARNADDLTLLALQYSD